MSVLYIKDSNNKWQAVTSIEGPPGPKGDIGPKGPQGERGPAFTYNDFTPEQLEELVAKQPSLVPSPVELFNIAFEG